MHIGIDFDNTIVFYDHLFHSVALEEGLIPSNLAKNKLAVRDYLHHDNKEDLWTLLQGQVYGSRMGDAKPCKGVLQFMKNAQLQGHRICIISHKTKYPFLGEPFDLHEAARKWINNFILENDIFLKHYLDIFFELTKEEKILRINSLECDVFIDDLPEILNMKGYLNKTKRILYDPEGKYMTIKASYQIANSWKAIEKILLK